MKTEEIQQLELIELEASNIPNEDNADSFLSMLCIGNWRTFLIFTLGKMVSYHTNDDENHLFDENGLEFDFRNVFDYITLSPDKQKPKSHYIVKAKVRCDGNNIYLMPNDKQKTNTN